jgi:hypothetical protein
MNRSPVVKILAVAACVAMLTSCGKSRRHSDPPAPDPIAFFDNFSGPFPDPNWDIMEGDPFTSFDEGNAAPALILEPLGDPIRLLSSVAFDTGVPVTVAFDHATFIVESDSYFRFTVRRIAGAGGDASFESFPFDDIISLSIMSSTQDFDFPPATAFDVIEFVVDSDGFATWYINGSAFMSRSGFPADLYEIEIITEGGFDTEFAVDNVLVTSP